ncbi:MAG TPA: DNA polymerase III subunit delta [Myxococcaceae bacterium]|nr:DNA polymerase III subunit delta [Myxococcaceae bacterium]
MSELAPLLAEIARGRVRPLYLAWGEEFLARRDADALVQALLPGAEAGLNLVALDGASPREVATELATLPLLPGRKVVVLRDPEFLAPKKGRSDALARARDAWKGGRRKEAGRRLLALVARAGWGPEALAPGADGAPSAEDWKEELGVTLADADLDFLREAAAFVREEGLTAPESDASQLLALLEGGMPPGHALVVAASDVDARHPLLRLAQSQGAVLERKLATRLRDLDLTSVAREFLQPHHKRLGPGAEEVLRERIGGNVRLLQSELEKLALHAPGAVIQRTDVELLVAHTRDEEFLELSDALQKRDLATALKYVEDALGGGAPPLLLLGAIASVVRGLAEAHERLSFLGRGVPPRSFEDFKGRLFPAIEREAREARGRVPHPYAAFVATLAAARYGRERLRAALLACAEADLALKSSGSGKLVLERLLWTVCPPSTGSGGPAARRAGA